MLGGRGGPLAGNPMDLARCVEAFYAVTTMCRGYALADDNDYLRFYRFRQRARSMLAAGDGDRALLEELDRELSVVLREYEHRMGDAARKGHWIPTVSGRRLFIEDPRPEEIEPEDIVFGLSRIPRFNGMTAGPLIYSVAQHSLIGSYLVEEPFALHFLLHDAHEYVGMDVTSPLKRLLGEPYAAVEARLKQAVADRFDIEWTEEATVECKRVDNLLLVAEVDALTPWGVVYGELPEAPTGMEIKPMDFHDVRDRFARRMNELYGEELVWIPAGE